jgi:hypothetical protein
VCAQHKHGFCRVGYCVRSSVNQDRAKKEVLGNPLLSQKLLKGQFHKLYEDLHLYPEKIFGCLGMTCSSFDELLSIIGPKITYRNTMMRAPVPPDERLAVTQR